MTNLVYMFLLFIRIAKIFHIACAILSTRQTYGVQLTHNPLVNKKLWHELAEILAKVVLPPRFHRRTERLRTNRVLSQGKKPHMKKCEHWNCTCHNRQTCSFHVDVECGTQSKWGSQHPSVSIEPGKFYYVYLIFVFFYFAFVLHCFSYNFFLVSLMYMYGLLNYTMDISCLIKYVACSITLCFLVDVKF